MDVSKWPIFSILEPQFVINIKLACVFGSCGNEALIVTKNDDVYALGSNCNGCLGIGDAIGVLEPKKLEFLCGKNVKGISYGCGPHVLAFTESGELYSWGNNSNSQLGNGATNNVLTPMLISTNLSEKKVVEVACGSHHSLVLTSDGEVYAFGQNTCGQIGCNSTANQPIPRKVNSGIGGRFAVSVICGQTSSMAILDNGEVYGWGHNGNGQLGVGNNTNQCNPCRVTNLNNVVIVQVVCGCTHTMALSDEGVLYSWGANSHGQLATGNKLNLVSPQKVATEIGRVVEIAASHFCHTSAALTQMSKVFMWGQCRGQAISSPVETQFQSVHDVFACFASPGLTWKPMQLDIAVHSSVADSLRLAFDDSETSDMKFLIDGKYIHVHKSILKIRCEHFRMMFQEHWEEDKKDVVEIDQFSYSVYRAFLQFLYTDEIQLSPHEAIVIRYWCGDSRRIINGQWSPSYMTGMALGLHYPFIILRESPHQYRITTGLLDLADSYCELQLKRYCEQIIKRGITVDNVALLYSGAIKHAAKELEEFCFRFAVNHLTSVAQTDAFSNLEEGTLKTFICKAAQRGAFKY